MKDIIIKKETEKALFVELTISRKNCIPENVFEWIPKSMLDNDNFINTKFKEIAHKYLSNFSNGQIVKKAVLNNTTVSFAKEKKEVLAVNNKFNHSSFGLCEIISSDDKFTTLKLENGDTKKVMTNFI